MDDDDDDFGGFETAEPGPDAVNQAQEASPSPWAVFPAGPDIVENRPDILCVQNRFPELLSSTGQDGSSGDVNNHQDVQQAEGAIGGQSFEVDFGRAFHQDGEVNLDDIALANEILDGSFAGSSALSIPVSEVSHRQVNGQSSGLDILGEQKTHQMDSRNNFSQHNINNCATPNLDSSQLHTETFNSGSYADDGGACASPELQDNNVSVNDLRKVRHGAVEKLQTENQRFELSDLSSCEGAVGGEQITKTYELSPTFGFKLHQDMNTSCDITASANNSSVDVSGSAATEENSRSRVQATMGDNSALEEIRKIRKESHAVVSAVVQEYKELMGTSLAEQQIATESLIALRLKEQEEIFKQKLKDQERIFRDEVDAAKQSFMDEKESAVIRAQEEQKAEFDLHLEKERETSKLLLQTSLEEEREKSERLLQEAIKNEREATQSLLAEQKEAFTNVLQEEREENLRSLQKTLDEERNKFKENLKEAIETEKKRGEEIFKLRQAELENKIKLSAAIQQRQMTSLDVFLEGARQQLSLLMSNTVPVLESNQQVNLSSTDITAKGDNSSECDQIS